MVLWNWTLGESSKDLREDYCTLGHLWGVASNLGLIQPWEAHFYLRLSRR